MNGDNFGKGSPAGFVSDSTAPASLPVAPLSLGKGSPEGLVSDSTVPASLPAASLSLDSVFSPHPTSAKVPSTLGKDHSAIY